MAEKDVTEHSNRKKIREPPSIPFLWEERPGIPKKDWKPGPTLVCPVPPLPPPVKLIASVPFNWEEKPGKPLSRFSQPTSESATLPPPAKLIALPLPPIHSQDHDNDHKNNHVDSDVGGNDEQWMIDLDLEALAFESDESFSSAKSAPSLLANCLLSSMAISTAVPVQETSLADDDISSQMETPSSPASETDSSTSSYATGTSSPVGASFLECLFPLLPPNSSFLEKVGYPEKGSLIPPDVNSKDFDRESNTSVMVSRPPTLGELIMMSRRRSYQRKAECNYDRNL